jgi:hypothetical protein
LSEVSDIEEVFAGTATRAYPQRGQFMIMDTGIDGAYRRIAVWIATSDS